MGGIAHDFEDEWGAGPCPWRWARGLEQDTTGRSLLGVGHVPFSFYFWPDQRVNRVFVASFRNRSMFEKFNAVGCLACRVMMALSKAVSPYTINSYLHQFGRMQR